MTPSQYRAEPFAPVLFHEAMHALPHHGPDDALVFKGCVECPVFVFELTLRGAFRPAVVSLFLESIFLHLLGSPAEATTHVEYNTLTKSLCLSIRRRA